MTRRVGPLVAATLLVALVLAGCGRGTVGASSAPGGQLDPVAENPTPELPVTVTSADGREVTVTDASRILPLWGNLNEIVFTLGLGDRVVGRDVAATFAGTEDLPVVTDAHDVSAESALSLEPTVVFAQTDTGPPEAIQMIRDAGVPVVLLDPPTSIEDIPARIRLVAAALGVPEAGEELVARTEAEIAEIQEAIPEGDAPTVAFLYLRGSAGVYLLGGPGSGADSMIEAAGGIDAGTELGLANPFTPLTSEALVKAAPDVLLLSDTGLASVGGIDALLQMPGIAQTPAARDRRVVTLEDGVLYSFGSRTPQALAELIPKIHGTGSAAS